MGIYSAPKPPDPEKTANSQFNYETGASQASSIINNPNTVDPYGSSSYKTSSMETVTLPNGKQIQVPRYTQTTALNDTGQKLFDQQQTLAGKSFTTADALLGESSRVGAQPWETGYDVGELNSNFRSDTGTTQFDPLTHLPINQVGNANTQSFNPLAPGAGDINQTYGPADGFSEDRLRVENAVFNRGNATLQPSRDSEVARLAAMGLTPGGAAYGRVSDQFETSQNDLALASVLAGGQEQSRLLGEDRTRASFENSAQGQEFNQNFAVTGAENQRRVGEVQLSNTANQAEFSMNEAQNASNTALQAMENARRTGDMAAYNAALEAYNNAQVTQTALDRDGASFNNQVRAGQIGETEALKNAEINRLTSILSGAQVQTPNANQFTSQGINAPDYSGLVQSNYAQQVAAHNAKLSGISSIFGAGTSLIKPI